MIIINTVTMIIKIIMRLDSLVYMKMMTTMKITLKFQTMTPILIVMSTTCSFWSQSQARTRLRSITGMAKAIHEAKVSPVRGPKFCKKVRLRKEVKHAYMAKVIHEAGASPVREPKFCKNMKLKTNIGQTYDKSYPKARICPLRGPKFWKRNTPDISKPKIDIAVEDF